MNIHEYQGKEILRNYGIPTPKGMVVFTVEEAIQAAINLNSKSIVIKAQIHAGGRGKAGGIKIVKDLNDTRKIVEQLFGKILITKQTKLAGKKITILLIEEELSIKEEYYVSITIDRTNDKIVILASNMGGIDVVNSLKKSSDKIFTAAIDFKTGLMPFQAERIAFSLNIPNNLVNSFVDILMKLYQVFIDKDCSLIEINPFALTNNQDLIALDAKFSFDDNALFRHPEIRKLRDDSEEKPNEIRASDFGFKYIDLEGNIGCIANGAGLAMATIDIIKYYGGEPANFLDIGGGASIEKVYEAFKMLLLNKDIKGVFVNIFGGIMKCDLFAKVIIDVVKENGLEIPLVVRMEGTNNEIGRSILEESNINISMADSISEGAMQIIKLIGNKRMGM